MIKSKRRLSIRKKTTGFTFIEVLAAILVATTFTLIATQAIVISVVFKVKARRVSEATNWIRGNLETVRFQAVNDKLPTSLSTLCANTKTNPATGFAADFAKSISGLTLTGDPPSATDFELRTLVNKPYTLKRTMVVSIDRGEGPYNTLKILYQVYPDDQPSLLLVDLQAEVTPEQAHQCGF